MKYSLSVLIMTVSYLITTHNEPEEFKKVFGQVYPYANPDDERYRGDEVVVLDDFSTDERMVKHLELLKNGSYPNVRVVQHALDGNFGVHKTFGSRHCSKNYIVQLDADEYLSALLIENLHQILEANKADLYRLPRVNIVRGLTQEDALRWGWSVTTLPEFGDLPIINWTNNGDYQSRIYRNDPLIYWIKTLHETVTGHKTSCLLPLDVDVAIIHDKTIDRQRAQNEFYNKNWSKAANMGRG